MQVCPPPLLFSPSMLSSMSHCSDVDHDISPDSGHRELSNDSLSTTANTQSDLSWHSALAASTTYHHELISRLRESVLSSPSYPVITSHLAVSSALSPTCDLSNPVWLGSPSQHLMRHTADISGRVLTNSAIRNSGLVSPADCNMSSSTVDKSLSHDDIQFFVNEDSMTGDVDGRSSALEDQVT